MQTAAVSNNKKTPVRYAFAFCRAEVTKQVYRKRLKWFFDFIGLEPATEDIEQQAQSFLDNARQDPDWATQQIMLYLDYLKQRFLKKEITSATIRGFHMPIRTFTNAYRDVAANIDWKRIVRAMPKAKEYASDRIPTLEELRRVVEYPDRRIKPLVYTMTSSGIRIGATPAYYHVYYSSSLQRAKGMHVRS
jgi:integrase